LAEYEKTIQSLENTLAEIRASLAQTESTLLEKESKLAYAESINQQLHARISKLSEREASNSEYIRKLETRIDENEAQIGASQEDLELVAELRIENQRLREHEHSSEAYLAVMEENLAEADADIEFWKREVDRLQKIVERQRGLAKLDTLLDELDEVQKDPTDADRSESVEHSDVTADSHIEKDHSKETTPETQTPIIVKPTEEEKVQAAVEDNFLRAELANLRKSHKYLQLKPRMHRRAQRTTRGHDAPHVLHARLHRHHRTWLPRSQRDPTRDRPVFRRRGSENIKDSSVSRSSASSGTTALILALALFGAVLGWGLRIIQERYGRNERGA
jgi:chromosome segregation ATPase